MTVALVHTPATELRHSSASNITGAITTPTAGNTLVCFSSSYTASECSVSDNQGNGWMKIAEIQTSVAPFLLSVHYAPNVLTGSPFNVTYDTNLTGHGLSLFVVEVANLDPVYPREPSEVATQRATGTAPATPVLTNSSLDAVAFAALAIEDGTDPITLTDPSGWSVVGEETLGATYEALSVLYKIVAGSVASSATWTTGNFAWATAICAFQGSPTLFGPPPGRGPG